MMELEVFSTQPVFDLARNAIINEEDGVPRIFESAYVMGLAVMLSALVVVFLHLADHTKGSLLTKVLPFHLDGFRGMSSSLSGSKIIDSLKTFVSNLLSTPATGNREASAVDEHLFNAASARVGIP